MSPDVKTPVTRSDLEAKLRQIKGEVDTTTEAARPYAAAVGAAAVVVVLGLTYLLGRRREKTTLVEIRQL
jgi:hypothetical protein